MMPLFLRSGKAVLTAGALLSLVNGMLYTWSAFMLPVEQATGWSRSLTSLVFTVVLVFFGLGMMSGGFFIRRWGPRVAAVCGEGMLAAGLLLSSCAEEPWQLIFGYGIMAGYGIGGANVAPSAVALGWYPEKRGMVCGIMACSLAAGTLLFGTVIAGRLNAVAGYAVTLRVFAAVVLLTALPAGFVLQYPENYRKNAPRSTGVKSLNTRQMLATSLFLWGWLWTCSIQTGGLMVMGHIVPYALEQGLSAGLAGALMGLYAVANGAGRLFFGRLFDTRGSVFAMMSVALSMIVCLLLLLVLPRVAGLFGLMPAVAGTALCFGGTIPIFSAFIAEKFGPRYMESNIGMTATVFLVAGFLGPYMGGYLYDLFGRYEYAIVFSTILVIPGIMAVAAMYKCSFGGCKKNMI